jgi:myo-inositol-1-phosphate synthase
MAPASIPTKTTFMVQSENTDYTDDYITSNYTYRNTKVSMHPSGMVVTPVEKQMQFRVGRKVPRMG